MDAPAVVNRVGDELVNGGKLEGTSGAAAANEPTEKSNFIESFSLFLLSSTRGLKETSVDERRVAAPSSDVVALAPLFFFRRFPIIQTAAQGFQHHLAQAQASRGKDDPQARPGRPGRQARPGKRFSTFPGRVRTGGK